MPASKQSRGWHSSWVRETRSAAGADTAQRRECRRADGLPAINSAIFDSYRRLPMPTIGLVDACALGDGAELAFACDFRV